MLATIRVRGVCFDADLSAPTDCSIAVQPESLASDLASAASASAASLPPPPPHQSVIAWNTPLPAQKPLQFDKYVLDTRQGGSCNANFLHFSPHTAGTHTECVGHITDERFTISHAHPGQTMHPCLVLSVQPQTLGESGETYAPGQPDDLVISAHALQSAIDAALDAAIGPAAAAAARALALSAFSEALVIRTLPNDASKKWYAHSI
jgi:hypothetical protein